MAYQSVANMFWEDMYQNVPESKNWVLVAATASRSPTARATTAKMGRVTRYMADLSKPAWREYLKKRIDLAIEAGADGIMYDNCLAGSTVDMAAVFQEIMQYSLGRKKDFLIMANFHRDKYILNRVLERHHHRGRRRGGRVLREEPRDSGPRRGERATMLPVDGGYLVNNIGLFRTFENLAEGWKPVMIESNLREVGVRRRTSCVPSGSSSPSPSP